MRGSHWLLAALAVQTVVIATQFQAGETEINALLARKEPSIALVDYAQDQAFADYFAAAARPCRWNAMQGIWWSTR
ncbi:MAG: hypothetical protein NVV74_14205 [Magnetospirillum sp.]|nr:hypothetical protein [Magnetospirillum sp.]